MRMVSAETRYPLGLVDIHPTPECQPPQEISPLENQGLAFGGACIWEKMDGAGLGKLLGERAMVGTWTRGCNADYMPTH